MHGQQNIKIIAICISSEALRYLMFMVQALSSCVSVSVLGSHRTVRGVAVPLWDFRTVFKIRFYLCYTEGIMARVDIMESRGIIVLFYCKADLHSDGPSYNGVIQNWIILFQTEI